jgi:hypothetical protein
VGFLAGADHEFSGRATTWAVQQPLAHVIDASADEEAVLGCECKDKDALTAACSSAVTTEQPFPRCPWAIDL